MHKPLLAANLPQLPTQTGLTGLGFVGEAYRQLSDLSHLDLRVGMCFTGARAAALHAALRDVTRTIRIMPATYLTCAQPAGFKGVAIAHTGWPDR